MDYSEQFKIDAVVLLLRDFCLRFLYGHAYKLASPLTQRIKHYKTQYKTKSYVDHYQYVIVNRTRLTLLLSLCPHNTGGLYSCRLFLFNDKRDSLSFKRIMNDPDSSRNVLGDDFVVNVNEGFDLIFEKLENIFKRK